MDADQWLVLVAASSPLIAYLLIVAWDLVVSVLVLDAPDALEHAPAGGER